MKWYEKNLMTEGLIFQYVLRNNIVNLKVENMNNFIIWYSLRYPLNHE